MTARDRIIVSVVLGAAILAGFWFAVLGPKRNEAHGLDAKVSAAQQRLTQAESKAGEAQRAKQRYEQDYATVARLGKAVPATDGVPSLVYQLESAAHGARIDFHSVQLGSPATGGTSTTSPSTSSGSSSAALPAGATVGSAGFPTMPFTFEFDGSYFDLERMLADVQRFVTVSREDVRVRGRLLSVDGVDLKTQDGGSQLQATVKATAYLLPQGTSVTGGATSSAPASATAAPPTATAIR